MSLVTKTGKHLLQMNDTDAQCSEHEEVYRLTLKGLLQARLGEETGREIYDMLELYCRRNECGMAIEDGRLGFVNMEPVE
jgi:uncharacterized membrane protein YhfC